MQFFKKLKYEGQNRNLIMSHPLPPKALMAAIVSAIFSFWFFRRFNILLSIIHISYPTYHKSFINLQISKQELNFLSIFSFFPISLPSLTKSRRSIIN